MNDSLFENIIGQEKAKKKINFFLNSSRKTRVLPHLLFVAQKGSGKTMMAKEVGKVLAKRNDGPKPILEINCSALKSVKSFFEGVVQPRMIDQDVTIIFDEASELNRQVTMALLTILNPNKENGNYFQYDGVNYYFDFRRHTFMFATTETQKVFHALLSRLERVDLEEYSNEQLAKIVQISLKDVEIEKDTLMEVADVSRGNAREAFKKGQYIKNYLESQGVRKFDKKVWQDIRSALSIRPKDINNFELAVLQFLREKGKETPLRVIASRTGFSSESISRDAELFLLKNGYMEIRQTGRMITDKGCRFLDSIKNEK